MRGHKRPAMLLIIAKTGRVEKHNACPAGQTQEGDPAAEKQIHIFKKLFKKVLTEWNPGAILNKHSREGSKISRKAVFIYRGMEQPGSSSGS